MTFSFHMDFMLTCALIPYCVEKCIHFTGGGIEGDIKWCKITTREFELKWEFFELNQHSHLLSNSISFTLRWYQWAVVLPSVRGKMTKQNHTVKIWRRGKLGTHCYLSDLSPKKEVCTTRPQ